ncbi:hypothetical protein [Rhodococcus sp. MALMAid1271]|uniref:hypothetical protein n=1 Tax=Rhodococcus sp. MALMAid1271 TaxID=3411744 RepID=UPI003BA0A66F
MSAVVARIAAALADKLREDDDADNYHTIDRLALELASVVAALPDIAIVPTTSVEYAPCWQNEHGVHPLNSTTAWRKGAEDDVERLSADDPEIFLGKHYRTPWIAARAAEGQA